MPKHWLTAYGKRVPAEIDPDAHGSVAEMLARTSHTGSDFRTVAVRPTAERPE